MASDVTFELLQGNVTMDETGEMLGVPERTLDRHWRYIRAWLMKRLS
jgi:hypothetical protein